jgi:hypothetical protein
MATVNRARAKLKIKTYNTASVTGRAAAVRDGLASDTTKFGASPYAPTAIDAQITTVNKAEAAARTKAPGTAAARNVQRTLLVGMLEKVLPFVQGLADASATREDAVATIVAAGLLVAATPQVKKQILTVKQGPQSGSVLLAAFAKLLGAVGSKKSCFNWQQTSDGGKTFINLPSTPKAKTTVTGLTPLATYGFRVSVTASDGTIGAWSQTVTIIVH